MIILYSCNENHFILFYNFINVLIIMKIRIRDAKDI